MIKLFNELNVVVLGKNKYDSIDKRSKIVDLTVRQDVFGKIFLDNDWDKVYYHLVILAFHLQWFIV